MNKTHNYTSIVIVILCLVFALVGCNNKKQNPRLKEIADTFNKQAPIQVDPLTTLDKLEALPENTLIYNYTITGELKEVYTIEESLKETLVDNIRYNPQSKELKEIGVTVIHVYKNPEGKTLFEIKITPDEYNKEIPTKSVEELIKTSVELTNKQLPIQLDYATMLVGSKYAAPDTLISLLDVDKNVLGNIELNNKILKSANVRNLRNTIDGSTMKLKNKKAIFKYIYSISDGEVITVIITPDDYKR